jgi:NADPH2:quinone reductase
MKALSFSALGDSDVLQYIEIPNPILKNDEILVEIRAL